MVEHLVATTPAAEAQGITIATNFLRNPCNRRAADAVATLSQSVPCKAPLRAR
jgi:hypothetical protein